MGGTQIAYQSALSLAKAIASKQISPVEIARATLDRQQALEPKLNSFVTITPELALNAATEAERAVMAGEHLKPLHGLPLSVKDVIPVKDIKLTLGSKAFANNMASFDAPVVERIKAAGGVIIGKTTCSEFGCKAVGDSPLSGITRNPWDTRKTSGGSSAGATASVAAGVTPFSVATDGGGSIRIPCSLTGLFGIKAQFARVPMHPPSAAPTLAHTGAIARSVRDAALLLSVESGFDLRDPFSVAAAVPDYLGACDRSPKGMRIAWSPTFGYAKPLPEVVAVAEQAANTFEELGCTVDLVEDVMGPDPVDLFSSEFYAGIGTRLKPILNSSRDLLDPAVAEILTSALNQTLEQYYSNVFRRYDLRDKIRLFFERYDLLLSPTLPVPAFDVAEDLPPQLDDSSRNVVSWVYYTYPFNLTGNPAASIPAGFTADGLPVGLQIVGPTNGETNIFQASGAFEEARPWADKRPPVDS